MILKHILVFKCQASPFNLTQIYAKSSNISIISILTEVNYNIPQFVLEVLTLPHLVGDLVAETCGHDYDL